MNNNNNNNTALVVPEFFGIINFDQLNKVIDALGQERTKLSPEDKEFALDAITSWEDTVIKKIEIKRQEARELIQCFIMDTGYNSFESMGKKMAENDMFLEIIDQIGANKEFDAYMQAINEEYRLRNDAPVAKADLLTTSINDSIENAKQYAADYEKHIVEVNAAAAKTKNAAKKLKEIFVNDARIAELVTRLKKFESNTGKFVIECSEKSQLAKLNVTINNDEVRSAIKELIDFTISI